MGQCVVSNKWFFAEHETFRALPFATPEDKSHLRDRMLKSEPDLLIKDITPNQKVDTDLDGK